MVNWVLFGAIALLLAFVAWLYLQAWRWKRYFRSINFAPFDINKAPMNCALGMLLEPNQELTEFTAQHLFRGSLGGRETYFMVFSNRTRKDCAAVFVRDLAAPPARTQFFPVSADSFRAHTNGWQIIISAAPMTLAALPAWLKNVPDLAAPGS